MSAGVNLSALCGWFRGISTHDVCLDSILHRCKLRRSARRSCVTTSRHHGEPRGKRNADTIQTTYRNTLNHIYLYDRIHIGSVDLSHEHSGTSHTPRLTRPSPKVLASKLCVHILYCIFNLSCKWNQMSHHRSAVRPSEVSLEHLVVEADPLVIVAQTCRVWNLSGNHFT